MKCDILFLWRSGSSGKQIADPYLDVLMQPTSAAGHAVRREGVRLPSDARQDMLLCRTIVFVWKTYVRVRRLTYLIKRTGVMQNQSVTSLQNETKFSFDARQNEKRGVLMKRKRLMIIIGLLIILGIAVLVVSGRKPYKNLEASDIVSATVHLIPPDKTIQITDIEELVPYLNEVAVYYKDDSYTDYVGQAVTVTLTMADGSREEIMEYNPFIIINGVGYRAKPRSCENLSNYANTLLDQEK